MISEIRLGCTIQEALDCAAEIQSRSSFDNYLLVIKPNGKLFSIYGILILQLLWKTAVTWRTPTASRWILTWLQCDGVCCRTASTTSWQRRTATSASVMFFLSCVGSDSFYSTLDNIFGCNERFSIKAKLIIIITHLCCGVYESNSHRCFYFISINRTTTAAHRRRYNL